MSGDILDRLLGRSTNASVVKDASATALAQIQRRAHDAGYADGVLQMAAEAKQKYGEIGAKIVLAAAGIDEKQLKRARAAAIGEVEFLDGFVRHTQNRATHLRAIKTFIEDAEKEKPGTLCIHSRPHLAGNLRLACHDLLLATVGRDRSMLWSLGREDGDGGDAYYEELAGAINASQKFDLRSVLEEDFHANASFADELETHGLLNLPFDLTLFEWSLVAGADVVAIWRNDDLDRPAFGPFVQIPHAGWAIWSMRSVAGCPLDAQARLISRAATVILQSRSAAKSNVEPPARLNQRRVAAGKLPLFAHTVVEIRGVVLGARGQGVIGTTRRSPRMHWRRGHLRHFRDDTGKVYRITPIAPMLVGSEALGKVEHDYMVSAAVTAPPAAIGSPGREG